MTAHIAVYLRTARSAGAAASGAAIKVFGSIADRSAGESVRAKHYATDQEASAKSFRSGSSGHHSNSHSKCTPAPSIDQSCICGFALLNLSRSVQTHRDWSCNAGHRAGSRCD